MRANLTPGRMAKNQTTHGSRPPESHYSYASAARDRKATVKQFADIIETAKKERNTIEIKFSKIRDTQEPGARPSRYIEMETLSEYIFTELGIKPAEIMEIDLNTGRSDIKQIRLKPGVDTDKLLSDFPDTYAGYAVNISKLTQTNTKVTFRNVPIEIPDEEILNLCAVYGKVEGKVNRETVTIDNTKLGKVKLPSATRFVNMKLFPGKKFNNYYWMEGPLPGDQGRRVTVLHYNQSQQCSHCLNTADTGCLGLGNGKRCEENGGQRAKMSEYMSDLSRSTGYLSLKQQYAADMAKIYNQFEGDTTVTAPDDMDRYVSENREELDLEEEERREGQPLAVYVSPI